MNSLPMLLRKVEDGAAVHIFAPSPILHRLRHFCQLSWAVKVDDGKELPTLMRLLKMTIEKSAKRLRRQHLMPF